MFRPLKKPHFEQLQELRFNQHNQFNLFSPSNQFG
jgi:hypothetical protein